jgi:hypothetical protein
LGSIPRISSHLKCLMDKYEMNTSAEKDFGKIDA